MDITYRANETAESLILKAGRETKKNLESLKLNAELFKAFTESKPELAQAIDDYIKCVKKLKTIETDGLLKEFTEVSKRLISAFNFADATKDRDYIIDGYIMGKKAPIYQVLEAAFNASLFKEEGLQRRFKVAYNISKNIFEFSENEFFIYAVPYIYYVDVITGRALRCAKKITDFECFYGGGVNVWYNNDFGTVYEDGIFLGKWVDATHNKKSGGQKGTTYKYITFSSEPYLNEYGGKVFKMPLHQVIAMCFFSLNTIQYCLGAGSLLTIDHKDGNSFNNGIMNLALVSRADNARKGSGKEKPVNFFELFHAMQIATVPILYCF